MGVAGVSVASVVRQHVQAGPTERGAALRGRAEQLAAPGPGSHQVPETAGQGQAPQHPPTVRLLGEVERSAADAGGHPLAHYWSRFEQNEGLPQSLTLRASSTLYKIDAAKQGAGPFDRPLTYPDGFVAAEYKVLTSTNIQGTTIPLSFEMNQFAPVRGWLGTTGERFIFSKYSARVTALDLNGRSDSLPRIFRVPQAVIYDQRFEDKRRPGLHLTWSPVGDSWPPADSPEVPTLLAKAVRDYDAWARSRPPAPGTRLMKALTRVNCFAVGPLFALILVVWKCSASFRNAPIGYRQI